MRPSESQREREGDVHFIRQSPYQIFLEESYSSEYRPSFIPSFSKLSLSFVGSIGTILLYNRRMLKAILQTYWWLSDLKETTPHTTLQVVYRMVTRRTGRRAIKQAKKPTCSISLCEYETVMWEWDRGVSMGKTPCVGMGRSPYAIMGKLTGWV